MKNPRKVKRILLEVRKENDFLLLGIVSPEADYKLCIALNRKLGISLRSISPVKIEEESGIEHIFSRYSDQGGTNGIIFSLISNRHGKNFLFRKLKNIDYILQVYDPDNGINLDNVISELKSIDIINAVFRIEPENIEEKNLKYLIT
jgi:hypothetical protein